jgi:acetolactate synthase-1/2/3 large subunit
MCLGCFDRNDPLSLGMIGMHGTKDANLAVHNSDLLVSVGARFSDRVTGDTTRFAKGAKIVQVDIDGSELGKNVDPHLTVYGDVKDILTALIPLVKRNKREEWNAKVSGWKRSEKAAKGFEPSAIIRTIHEVYGDDTIVATDVGQHQMWTAQNWPFSAPRRLITSGGLGTMGFGLGAAIGSSIANPGKRVILVTGDGSFRMNLNELLTVDAQGLPITVFVMKNRTLGMVRQWQKLFFERRYSATDLPDNLDYIALGKAMGAEAVCVSDLSSLRTAATEMRDSGKPGIVVCDIFIDENVWPIVPPGDAINNQVTKE